MYTYVVKKNDYAVGQVKGKNKAVEFIVMLLKHKNEIGVWDGLKCESESGVYTIERLRN